MTKKSHLLLLHPLLRLGLVSGYIVVNIYLPIENRLNQHTWNIHAIHHQGVDGYPS